MTSPPLNVAGIAVSPDHYINGQRVASSTRFELFSPIDQRQLGKVCEGGAPEVQAAITAAQQAFPAWSALTAAERKPYLDRFADEIGQRADALGQPQSHDPDVLRPSDLHTVCRKHGAVLGVDAPQDARPLVTRFEEIWATGEPGLTGTTLGL